MIFVFIAFTYFHIFLFRVLYYSRVCICICISFKCFRFVQIAYAMIFYFYDSRIMSTRGRDYVIHMTILPSSFIQCCYICRRDVNKCKLFELYLLCALLFSSHLNVAYVLIFFSLHLFSYSSFFVFSFNQWMYNMRYLIFRSTSTHFRDYFRFKIHIFQIFPPSHVSSVFVSFCNLMVDYVVFDKKASSRQ